MFSDLLSSQMLFDSDGVVGASLERMLVSDNHALSSVDHADTSDDVSGRNTIVVARELANLEERRASVGNLVDSLTSGQLASLIQLGLLFCRYIKKVVDTVFQLGVKFLHLVVVGQVLFGLGVDLTIKCFHVAVELMREDSLLCSRRVGEVAGAGAQHTLVDLGN